jgi:hypothetical protein
VRNLSTESSAAFGVQTVTLAQQNSSDYRHFSGESHGGCREACPPELRTTESVCV